VVGRTCLNIAFIRTLPVLLIPTVLFPFLYVWLISCYLCYNILTLPFYYSYFQASFVELAFRFRSFRLTFLYLNNFSPSSAHTNVNCSLSLRYVTNEYSCQVFTVLKYNLFTYLNMGHTFRLFAIFRVQCCQYTIHIHCTALTPTWQLELKLIYRVEFYV
jgi:hypothetical protein